MVINIIIEDGNVAERDNFDEVQEIATNIHETLCGNQDYVDSNIVLNFNPPGPAPYQHPDTSTINLGFILNDCKDSVTALKLLRDSVDKMIEKLSE